MIDLHEVKLGKTRVIFNNHVCVFTTLQWIPSKKGTSEEYQVALADIKSLKLDLNDEFDPDHLFIYTGVTNWDNIKNDVFPYPNSAKFITE